MCNKKVILLLLVKLWPCVQLVCSNGLGRETVQSNNLSAHTDSPLPGDALCTTACFPCRQCRLRSECVSVMCTQCRTCYCKKISLSACNICINLQIRYKTLSCRKCIYMSQWQHSGVHSHAAFCCCMTLVSELKSCTESVPHRHTVVVCLCIYCGFKKPLHTGCVYA